MQIASQEQLAGLLDELEMDNTQLGFLMQPGTWEEKVQKLNAFKCNVGKQRRILAKKYHPDKVLDMTGNDMHMARINTICDMLSELKMIPKQPMLGNNRLSGGLRETVYQHMQRSSRTTTDSAASDMFNFRFRGIF
jgi:DnaJ-class molecular chaperone